MPAWSDLLSMPTVWLLLILSVNGWHIFSVVTKKPLPGMRLNWKEGTAEVAATHKEPTIVEGPPPPNVGTAPSPNDQSAGNASAALVVFKGILEARKSNDLNQMRAKWDELQSKLLELDDTDRELMEVEYLRLRIELGDDVAPSNLEQLSERNAKWTRPAAALGWYYFNLADYVGATRWAKVAQARLESPSHYSNALALFFEISEKTEDWPTTVTLAHTLASGTTNASARAYLFAKVADRLIDRKEHARAALYFHIALKETPTDNELRFDAAYKLADQEELKAVAYVHYRAVERVSPNRP